MDKTVISFRTWFKIALCNLLLATLLGVTLRLAFVIEVPWFSFRNLLHSHSHMAMIGWGYLAIIAMLMQYFGRNFRHQRIFRLLYFCNQIAVIGMFFTFPVYGYAGIPLFFTTTHLIFTYLFAYFFLGQLRKCASVEMSVIFVRASIYFHILSTLAIWLLPILILNDLRHTAIYQMAVQFFLHFQINGWFVFATAAIFFQLIKNQIMTVHRRDFIIFYRLLILATFFTYALAVTWSEPKWYIFMVNTVGVLLQFLALIYLLRIIRKIENWGCPKIAYVLFQLSLIFFVTKILLQTLVAFPDIAIVAYTIRNFVVGFLHLILLGFLTMFLFAMALQTHWMDQSSRSIKIGLFIFILGFLTTEVLLFYQGTLLWVEQGFLINYDLVLFLLSLLFPVSITLLLTKSTNVPTANFKEVQV